MYRKVLHLIHKDVLKAFCRLMLGCVLITVFISSPYSPYSHKIF